MVTQGLGDATSVAAVGFTLFLVLHERERLLRTTQAVEASQKTLATALGGLSEGVLAEGPDGRLVLANEAAAQLLGATPISIDASLARLSGDTPTSGDWELLEGLWLEQGASRRPLSAVHRCFEDGSVRRPPPATRVRRSAGV